MAASMAAALMVLSGCQTLHDQEQEQPVVVEQHYSPAPTWLNQSNQHVGNELLLVYRSPAVVDLDLAAQQLHGKIAMFAKEQLAIAVADTFIAAQPAQKDTTALGRSDRDTFRQMVARLVARQVDGDAKAIQIDDYYYHRTRTGAAAPLATVFALVRVPHVDRAVAATAQALEGSPLRSLRRLARRTD